MFSSDPSECKETTTHNLLELKLESTNPPRNLNLALADHNYSLPQCTERIALADHRYCKLEPEYIHIELELVNEEVACTSEFGQPRIIQEGLTNEITKPAIKWKQKVGNAVPRNQLAGPLCWKRRQQRKQKVKNAVSKNKLTVPHSSKSRRPVKRKKKINKLLLQCKVEVLDVRDTLYCHECGVWSLTADDLLCHTLMTHDIDISEKFQGENQNVTQDLQCMFTENLNDNKSTFKQFQAENQRKYPQKFETENQYDNKIQSTNSKEPENSKETEKQNICPEKSETEHRNDNKSKGTNSKGQIKVLPENQAYPPEPQKQNQNDNKIENTELNEPIEISFKEEYLDEDLYDNIFPCENENLQIYSDEFQAETQNDKKVKTKSKESNKSKTKKPKQPNKLLLKSQKERQNNGKTSKSKAGPKGPNKIFQPDLKRKIVSQNQYKIKRTKLKGPNILILPCKEETQTENQNDNQIKNTKSKRPNKKITENQQIYPHETKIENQNGNRIKSIKSERPLDILVHKTKQSKPSIFGKQKLEIEVHFTNEMELLPCKVEVPDVKDTLYCNECGEWSMTPDDLLYHTLMKHSAHYDMYQSYIKQCQEENQEKDPLAYDDESQKENQNYNTIKRTKSKEKKRKGEGKKIKQSIKENKVFPCDLCNKSFTRPWWLDNHKRAHEKKPFSCEICSYMFDSEEKCATHEKSHLGIKKFACDFCQKTFDTRNALEMHTNSHIGAKPYMCDACENTFAWKGNLRKHLEFCSKYNNGNTPPKRYKCEQCDFKARVQSQVKRHFKDVHGSDVFICDTCDRRVNTKAKMESHILVHATNKPFKCKLCDVRCATEPKLKDHITACHLATKKFTCKECKKGFKTATCLKRHEIIHSGIRPHTCQICNRSFALKTGLNNHILSHSSDKPFSCVMCGSQFRTRFALISHQEIHKENRKIYVCAHCGDVLSSKTSFLRHLKSCLVLQGLPKKKVKRTSSKLTYCEQCNKTFTYNFYVTKHKDAHKGFTCVICNMKFKDKQRCDSHELRHAGLKAYACDLCNKRFICKTSLSDHMNKHMKRKPYSCNLCPQRFAYKSNIHAHKRNFHSKTERLKTHECNVCHKKYFMKNHLRRHILTHNKDKPCPCKKCGKRFTDKNQLRLHVKSHNNIKPYSCNSCKKSFKTKGHLKDHIFYTHERYTIKLACDICNRVFRDKVSLKAHMVKHKNLKIYSCDVCEKSFYTRQYLNRHRLVHNEKFAFSCSECKVTFKEKLNIVKHLLTHTDKPYICEVCDEAFRTHRLLQYHAVIHEAVPQLYPCEYCSKAYFDKNSKRRHEKDSCIKALRNRNKLDN